MHVADGVDVDQRAHAGDEQAHGDAQRVGEEGDVDLQVADGQPLEQRDDVGALLGGGAEEVDERGDGDDEGAGQHRRGEVAGARIAETAAEHDDRQEPSQRQGRNQPDQIKHGASLVRSLRSRLRRPSSELPAWRPARLESAGRPAEPVDQRAGGSGRSSAAGPTAARRHRHPLNSVRSSAVAPGRRRRMATMIPRPTTASAAATTRMKNTAV